MIRKTITRTIERSTIKAHLPCVEDGIPVFFELEPVTVWGRPNQKEAQRAVNAAHGRGAIITDIETVSEMYEITLDAFVAAATRIEPN